MAAHRADHGGMYRTQYRAAPSGQPAANRPPSAARRLPPDHAAAMLERQELLEESRFPHCDRPNVIIAA
ncbi:hypothetical protein [Sphingomonas sp.]|uniref:hypothetical protein n=1 Tax=Sphingomonas sp. TaxID=28214 RepID=UPI0031DC3299